MNKIYKVVWNKARNCYVVASEFAKNQSKSCSTKKVLAMMLVTGMMTTGGAINNVQAANNITNTKIPPKMVGYEQTWDTDVQNGKLGTSITGYQYQGNNLQLNFLKFEKYKTKKGENALAIRLGSYVDGINKSGNLYFTDTNTKNTHLSTSINEKGIINSILTDSDNNKVESTVDISNYVKNEVNKKTDYHLIANTAKNSEGVYNVDDAGNIELLVADDTNKKINTVKISNVASKDSVAVIYDKNKSLRSTNAGVVGPSSIALGDEATTGWMSIALGDKTKATGEDATAIGYQAEATALDSIAIGGNAKSTGGDSIAIGNDTNATSLYSVAIGDDIHFTGNSATAVGQQAHATGDCSTALGAMTNVDDDYNASHTDWRKSGEVSTAIGYGSGSWGDYSTALGAFAKTENQFSSAIGYNSQATAQNAVALGAAAKANVYGGVALGTLSVADREKGVKGVFAPEKINATDKSTWISTAGAVSVGDTEKNITRQITHVAAGREDTDAVNVAQLKRVNESLTNQISQSKIKVSAGKNIKVDADTKDDGHTEYNVFLDDDITLGNNASDNFVTVSGTKGTIWASHSISAGNVIMDGDSGTITGLTNTTWNGTTNDASRAATEGQLQQVANAAISNDKRLVQNSNGGDGSYQVKENGDVTLRVEDSNKNGYDVTIKNVASKAELDKVKADVGNVDGFHDEIKNKGEDGKPTHTSVVDAVNNLDTKVNTIQSDVTKATAEAKKHSSVSTGNGLDLDVTDNDGQKDYKVSLKDDFTIGGKDGQTGNISFKGSEGNITASGTITAGTVSAGNTSISDTGLQIGDKTSLTKNSLTIGGNTYITDKGIDANKQKISNVADGDISKDSKDAVNGSQLYAANEAIVNNYNNITNLNGRINNLDNRVNKVGAGAAALAALHPLDFDPDAKWDFAAGYGNYRGTNAAAVGAYYRPNEDTMFSIGGTFGNGENMVNAGVSFKLGAGSSHVSTSRVAMAKEIKELRSELEAMKSAVLDANAGKKVDTSKLQLFPDVPQNHWAYEYITQLAGNGMIEGYPDGNFAGDRPMTRYEFAAILYRAMTKGAVLSDKILSEFSHELEYFTVDTIAKDKTGNPTIQRVRTVKENINK